jgi:dethiobiotin synthetase
MPVAALKPLCSGNRADARSLHAALNGALKLDEINPWHFRAPIAPLLASRCEQRTVTLAEVLAHARRMQKRFPLLIIEGAGGLLSPLGENFDSRDLIRSLRAIPIVACPNRLGAVNQIRLVIAALPKNLSRKAQIVLVSPKHPDVSSRSNPRLLREIFGPGRVHILPRLPFRNPHICALQNQRVHRTLTALVRDCLGA